MILLSRNQLADFTDAVGHTRTLTDVNTFTNTAKALGHLQNCFRLRGLHV